MRVPVEVVVDGVIDAAAGLTAVAEVEGRDAGVLQERRVVGPRPQRRDAQVLPLAGLAPLLGRVRVGDAAQLLTLPHAEAGLGIGHVPRYLIDELLQAVRPGQAEVAATVRIAVQVRDGVRGKLVRMRLDPLRGPEQARLLAVPGRVHDRAAGSPPPPQPRSARAGLLEPGPPARVTIPGAVEPGSMVVAPHDP